MAFAAGVGFLETLRSEFRLQLEYALEFRGTRMESVKWTADAPVDFHFPHKLLDNVWARRDIELHEHMVLETNVCRAPRGGCDSRIV